MKTSHVCRSLALLTAFLALPLSLAAAAPFDVVLNAQGEFLDAYLIDGNPVPKRVVFIDPDPPDPQDLKTRARVGRHVNGRLCFFPKGFGPKGGFVIADDTYREACLDIGTPQARCAITNPRDPQYVGKDPDGWGVFKKSGKWAKWQIHAEHDFSLPGESQGTIDPQGCLFDAQGNLWGNDVGHGAFGANDGSLIVFFPGPKKRYDTYCFVDKTLAAPSMPVADAFGNIYLSETAGARITKFSPPFPSSAADCANPGHLVTIPPTKTVFAPDSGLGTPSGITHVRGTDRFLIASVLIPAVINEYSATGAFVRNIVPAGVPKNPLGIDTGTDGTVYYSELNLDPVTFDTRCGSVSRARFDTNGQPLPPEELGRHLRFPDGVTVVSSKSLKVKWSKLPLSPDIDPSRCGGE